MSRLNLLIITQKVDKNDPILGFFHRWIEEFAKHCAQVSVICLQEGEHTLPANVSVYSLGKEKHIGKLTQLIRLYSYILTHRKEYDAVFVHMNPEYLVLAGVFFRLLGKKVGLWYAHGAVSLYLRVGIFFSHIVFTSTDEGLRVYTKKKCVMGQGIDTNHFNKKEIQKDTILRLITVGRLSPSKNIETLLKACARLSQKIYLSTLLSWAMQIPKKKKSTLTKCACLRKKKKLPIILPGMALFLSASFLRFCATRIYSFTIARHKVLIKHLSRRRLAGLLWCLRIARIERLQKTKLLSIFSLPKTIESSPIFWKLFQCKFLKKEKKQWRRL